VTLEQVYHCIQALVSEDLFYILAKNIHRLPFEARKDVQMIFSTAFRYKHPGSTSVEPDVLHYVVTEYKDIIIELCNGYNQRESASQCGSVLREALKFESVAELILYDGEEEDKRMLSLSSTVTNEPAKRKGVFWKLFDWIAESAFEISTDAFSTFRVCAMHTLLDVSLPLLTCVGPPHEAQRTCRWLPRGQL
jgi:calcium binding protein 39